MDDHFFTAYFPDEATVCGRRLDTFSPFHYLILRALASPFLARDGVIATGDLLVAVKVCTKRFGDRCSVKPSLKDAYWKLRMMRNPALFRRECKKFAAWMGSHSSGPRFWEVVTGGQKTRDLTGPDVLTLIVPLMTKAHLTEKQAWDISLGRAQWISAEIAELDGSERRFLWDGDLEDEEAPDA